MSEASRKRPRISIWLTLIIIALAASQMHPGLSTLLVIIVLLVLMMMLRLAAHYEGAVMFEEAESHHHFKRGPLMWEAAISAGISIMLITAISLIFKHVPWFWFPVAS